MSADELLKRIENLETSVQSLIPSASCDAELISALKDGTLTPAQLNQIHGVAGEDIRIHVILTAEYRRIGYLNPVERRWDHPMPPVRWAIETLARPVCEDLFHTFDASRHSYLPDWWSTTRCPFSPFMCFAWWARSALMDRLLGQDGGLSIRQSLDKYFATGIPPVDVDRLPELRVYRLLNPINSPVTLLDAELLPEPTEEIGRLIGEYYDFDYPEWDRPYCE